MKFYKYTAIFEKESGTKETYNVQVPALPGCLTFGESFSEAEYNIQEAIELYLSVLIDEGKEVPMDKKLRVPKGAISKEILVAVKHEVSAGISTYETAQFASA